MNILIAPDSFKGNMRSEQVCRILEQAFRQEMPDATITSLPMADGGEGTVEAMVAATGGKLQSVEVSGPLGDPVNARYGLLPDGTAVMEMAAASGIELLPAEQLNPMMTSTYGTGELLRHLIEAGRESIVMGIGGSATVDGGTGLAQALGVEFRDRKGEVIEKRGGQILGRIHDLADRGGSHRTTGIRVACDVTNPLTGPDGAAAVFGPQKGATPEMIDQLDAGLANLRECCGLDEQPGDGAAGGLGYGLRAFCSAEIVPGAQLIAETVGLPGLLEHADLLITGEGRTDSQTASGKLCSVLAAMARERGCRSLLLSGSIAGNRAGLLDQFDYAFSISSGQGSLEDCIREAPEDLAFVARNVARLLTTT